jgi:TPR repeat protein
MKPILQTGLLALAIMISAVPANAGAFEDDKAAIGRGDYGTVLQHLEPLADQGNADAQFNLGLMYRDGRGVPQDDAAAYMWLTLATAQGDKKAKEIRDNLAKRMTHGQIEEATLLVREWRREHPQ